MIFTVPKNVQKSISDLALATDEEICGYWVQGSDRVIPAKNLQKDSQHHFKIDGEFHSYILAMYDRVVIYHSHIGEDTASLLSHTDIESSKRLKIPYLVYHRDFAEWDYFDPDNLNPYPLIDRPYDPSNLDFYLGIPWQWDRFDCYSLFRNYYLGMLGIKLRDFSRRGEETAILETTWNQYTDNYKSQGFLSIPLDSTLQNNDVLLMTLIGEQIHHAVIVIDAVRGFGIQILGEHRVSERIAIGEAVRRRTKLIIRHNNFTVE